MTTETRQPTGLNRLPLDLPEGVTVEESEFRVMGPSGFMGCVGVLRLPSAARFYTFGDKRRYATLSDAVAGILGRKS